jgi:hypothetical protein
MLQDIFLASSHPHSPKKKLIKRDSIEEIIPEEDLKKEHRQTEKSRKISEELDDH